MNEFKLIVAGGRDFLDYTLLSHELMHLVIGPLAPYKDHDVSIVSGMARGADALGAKFARANGVQLYEFPADWDKHGKRAGFMRNEQMGNFADGLVAFYSGSNGTGHMIKYMHSLNKPVWVIPYNGYIYESPRPNPPNLR